MSKKWKEPQDIFPTPITEHPDVQRLIIQVETLSRENKRLEGEEKKKWEWVVHWKGKCVELQAENAKLKEIIKRFVDIAEALKGGCWE